MSECVSLVLVSIGIALNLVGFICQAKHFAMAGAPIAVSRYSQG